MSSEVVTFFVDSGKIFSLALPLFAFMYNDLASLFDADDICIVQSCSGWQLQSVDLCVWTCYCAGVSHGKRMKSVIPSVVEDQESDDDDEYNSKQICVN